MAAAGDAGLAINASLSGTSVHIEGEAGNVIGIVPGASARTIIVNAHADAWFTGADDNATGLAALLALADYFASRPLPNRTLVFIASAGHHTGNGLADFRRRHGDTLLAKCGPLVNLEHLATSCEGLPTRPSPDAPVSL